MPRPAKVYVSGVVLIALCILVSAVAGFELLGLSFLMGYMIWATLICVDCMFFKCRGGEHVYQIWEERSWLN